MIMFALTNVKNLDRLVFCESEPHLISYYQLFKCGNPLKLQPKHQKYIFG